MCGIVFKYNFDKKKPVNNDILDQYDKQRSRGQQGFGLFDGQFMKIVRESREDGILKWLCTKDSNLIMFHHRFPTSTVNVAKAAHPFSTKKFFGNTEYIMVHNGVIRNADEMWVKHQEMGIRYSSLLNDLTFNDSEALMWELALTMEGKQEKVEAYGDMAFIIMKKVKGKLVDMFYGRNSRPLMIKRTEESIELASEGPGVSILSDTLYRYDFITKETTKRSMEFPQYRSFPGDRRPWNYNSSYIPRSDRPQQQLVLPAATHDDYDSYDEWYAARQDMDKVLSSTTNEGKTVVDKEANWKKLREKYGSPMVVTDENVDDLTKALREVLDSERLDSASAKSIQDILETKRDKSRKFIVAEVKHEELIDLDSLDVRDYRPEAVEIQNCVMEYMIEAQGNYEDAYSLLEYEYGDFLVSIKGKETFEDVRQQLLMESAMEFINKDPEYRDERSVSSIWQALWYQQQVARA